MNEPNLTSPHLNLGKHLENIRTTHDLIPMSRDTNSTYEIFFGFIWQTSYVLSSLLENRIDDNQLARPFLLSSNHDWRKL